MNFRLRVFPGKYRPLSTHVHPFADSHKQLGNSELSWQNGFLFFLYMNGSVFDRKNKEVEPELTREEMDKLTQTRI
jgi:hypothetical protein